MPVALAFAVLDLTSSATSLGLVLVAAFVPRVVLLLLGGVVADRWPRRRVMLATDVVRASTQALVAFVLLSGQARLWHLALLFAAYGAADAFFSPASTGLVPEVVPGERLQEANALLSLSRSATTVAGPALAGLLVALSAPATVFAVDAATFVVSALSLALLREALAGRIAARRAWLPTFESAGAK